MIIKILPRTILEIFTEIKSEGHPFGETSIHFIIKIFNGHQLITNNINNID